MIAECRLCSYAPLQPLRRVRSTIRSTYTGMPYTLYQCNGCGSQLFDAQEHPADLEQLYDALAEQKQLTAVFRRDRYWASEVERIARIRRRTAGIGVGSVLDVGCRTGDFLMHWSESSVRRVGVELSEHAAAIGRERGLEIHQTFIEDLDLDEKFDVVSCYAILEHLERPVTFLSRLTELVADDGVVALLVPSAETLKARALYKLRYPWHMHCPPEHLTFFSREYLDGYLRSRGFKLATRTYTSGGMFNPFQRVPLAGRAFSRFMWWVDTYSPLNRAPMFDHMYSYYVKDR